MGNVCSRSFQTLLTMAVVTAWAGTLVHCGSDDDDSSPSSTGGSSGAEQTGGMGGATGGVGGSTGGTAGSTGGTAGSTGGTAGATGGTAGSTGGTAGATGGTAGATGGTAGATGGTAGATGGTGGATGGTAGATGGTGGATGGTGGSTGGTGGSTGGTGGATGGTGGTGGCPTSCGALEECGINGYCVAKSVATPNGYSIDATEVTRSQYDAWLATNPSTGGQPTVCNWNTNFQASCQWPPGTQGNHPVVCVDWCDAYAYCQAVGKRLCGKIGGGTNGYDDYADASKSQWYAACSSGGTYTYPYGNTYEGQTCNGVDKEPYTTSEVGSFPGCQSSALGYEGVYDMSGNVDEWEDLCDGNTGNWDDCRVRGGSFSYDYYGLRCAFVSDYSRDNSLYFIGFRCCSAP